MFHIWINFIANISYCSLLLLDRQLVWVGLALWSIYEGSLMPNPLNSYILNIYDLVWLGFMAYQPL